MRKTSKTKINYGWFNRRRADANRFKWKVKTSSVRVVKRAIDVLSIALILLLMMPLFAVVSVAIKLYDRGPVLFWQRRVGQWGREFEFPKFRSMHVRAPEMLSQIVSLNQHGKDGVTFKLKRDPRVTPIGRFIRRFSIDELPQLWCVLKGDMTLVGPRPPVPSEVHRYSLHDRERLSVTPGLTCIWQVSGRSEIPFEQQVQMDIEYIQRPSIKADLRLLAQTIPAVISGRGAY